MGAKVGNAGVVATLAIGLMGVVVGAASAYLAAQGASLRASTAAVELSANGRALTADGLLGDARPVTTSPRVELTAPNLRGIAPSSSLATNAALMREERFGPALVSSVDYRKALRAEGAANAPLDVIANTIAQEGYTPAPKNQPVGLAAAPQTQPPIERPKIILIMDDLGLNRAATEQVMALPGPLTLSFLPYVADVQSLADRANARGDDVLLHLPMEPLSAAHNPGPNAVKAQMSRAQIKATMQRNLTAFDGYIGVNNHMGSRVTQNSAVMAAVLNETKANGLFFLDSITTGRTVVAKTAEKVAAPVLVRDAFLDDIDEPGAIMAALERIEKTAQERGFAIAIAHPRQRSLDIIGPWLTTLDARGFELAPISVLYEGKPSAPYLVAQALKARKQAALLAKSAPQIRDGASREIARAQPAQKPSLRL